MLRSLGIEKGKPFAPDAVTKDILTAAMQEARGFFDEYYESYPPYFEGKRWFLPYDPQLQDALSGSYLNGDIYPMDSRAVLYYAAFSSVKHPGAGQFYLFNSRDANGDPLDGSATYRLHVPPNPPVRQYWSAVLYDFATHCLIRDVARAGLASDTPGLKTNADGSVDLYFGPADPGRERRQLDPDQSRGPVRGALPLLRSGEAALRQDVGAARHREDSNITGERITWRHEEEDSHRGCRSGVSDGANAQWLDGGQNYRLRSIISGINGAWIDDGVRMVLLNG